MTSTHFALIFFTILFSFLIPWIVKKYKIEDDIKFKKTLPIGSAQFKGFIKVALWLIALVIILGLLLNIINL